ncbi:MAG: carboxymuconolactone decarboxylase family protein [Oceanospirillaceae bacterium]
MNKRAEFYSVSPKMMQILLEQEQQISQQMRASNTLNLCLLELIKLRVSQINQCAYCIDMHTKDAFENGESAQRIIGLSAWREMLCYSKHERTALGWAELVISDKAVTDEMYQQTLSSIGEQGIVDLTFAVNAINSWNKVARVFKPQVGVYQVKATDKI